MNSIPEAPNHFINYPLQYFFYSWYILLCNKKPTHNQIDYY